MRIHCNYIDVSTSHETQKQLAGVELTDTIMIPRGLADLFPLNVREFEVRYIITAMESTELYTKLEVVATGGPRNIKTWNSAHRVEDNDD